MKTLTTMMNQSIAIAALATMPMTAQAQQAARPIPPVAPLPEASPQQLAAATIVAERLMPTGSYRRYVERDLPRWTDDMVAFIWPMTQRDLAAMMPKEAGVAAMGLSDNKQTFGQMIEQADPAMKERITIMSRIVFRHFAPMMDRMEAPVRASMARNLARRMSVRDLNSMAQFLATPAGRSFADIQMAAWLPDAASFFDIMKQIPDLVAMSDKRAMQALGEEIKTATAHLPPAPWDKPKAAPADLCDGDAACIAQMEIAKESGDEPWYEAANWSASERAMITRLEADLEKKQTISDMASEQLEATRDAAVDRARTRFKAQGWKPPVKQPTNTNKAAADAAAKAAAAAAKAN